MSSINHFWLIRIMACGLISAPAFAQVAPPIPGGADVGRVEKNREIITPPSALQPSASSPEELSSPTAPEQSKKIHFVLRSVTIEGVHAFPLEEIEPIYADYIGKEVTLDVAWTIAAKITTLYHQKGYFLSRAYVPKQQIANGNLRISVVEGYVSDVTLDPSLSDSDIIQEWISRIKQQHPLTSDYLESALLQLNDIPGVSLRGTLEPAKTARVDDGAVRLVLTKQTTSGHGYISFDNNGSRFLGPYQLATQYENSFVSEQQTSFNFLTSVPTRELQYGTVKQHIAAFPGGYADVYAGYTKAYPGYTIRSSDIQSTSLTFGTSLSYQLIRQRQENLSGKLAFETRDTHSDIFTSTPLTRDHIRALRASLNYETTDRWQGFNQLNIIVSQGLSVLNSSKSGDLNLSRPEATPDFTKSEFYFTRSQSLYENLGLVTSAAGQIASGPLYSAEEFGYGGSAFGRAYDASEITGDHGIAASVELRYSGMDNINGISPVPFGFYDAGAVFNEDRTQEKSTSGSSAGFGVRLATESGPRATVTAAFPLTRPVSSPLYTDSYGPRYMFELGYGF